MKKLLITITMILTVSACTTGIKTAALSQAEQFRVMSEAGCLGSDGSFIMTDICLEIAYPEKGAY